MNNKGYFGFMLTLSITNLLITIFILYQIGYTRIDISESMIWLQSLDQQLFKIMKDEQ